MSGPKERDQPAAEPNPPALNNHAITPKQPINTMGLSEKEREVLRWAVQGKTVWEISQIRAVSPATVKFHLHNIYSKLQVGNRVQAVAEAVKRGLCE
ncbi:helix-turn-helix transcriptional regulator [Pseudomonas sp. ADAK18]|uniref:response regulator transcription factor n=1 Tax=Pseudomonas sp. ADAK18 TaxID=2730848 RepID=UPI001463066D|nr:helix-turn-helix transcriptional regulator [Pseudomonas sp. ADAK18]QJI28145.1 helix-turn-helix transcriptional regulator [Pseudomonas sp. ADAK18]